jgi:uncharacterized membrane protein
MKIISIILTFVGFVLCFVGSVGVQVLLRQTLAAMMDSETGGIGAIARGFDNTFLSNYVALFGCLLVFIGLLINIISLLAGRKQQQAI